MNLPYFLGRKHIIKIQPVHLGLFTGSLFQIFSRRTTGMPVQHVIVIINVFELHVRFETVIFAEHGHIPNPTLREHSGSRMFVHDVDIGCQC